MFLEEIIMNDVLPVRDLAAVVGVDNLGSH